MEWTLIFRTVQNLLGMSSEVASENAFRFLRERQVTPRHTKTESSIKPKQTSLSCRAREIPVNNRQTTTLAQTKNTPCEEKILAGFHLLKQSLNTCSSNCLFQMQRQNKNATCWKINLCKPFCFWGFCLTLQPDAYLVERYAQNTFHPTFPKGVRHVQ